MFKYTGARLPGKTKDTFQQGVIYTEALCFSRLIKINLSYNKLGYALSQRYLPMLTSPRLLPPASRSTAQQDFSSGSLFQFLVKQV